MRISRLVIPLLVVAVLAFSTVSAFAGDFAVKNWRVYNVMPSTAAFWDINKAQAQPDGSLSFPIQQFESTTSGSFAVYLLANYNVDMTDKTISATGLSWTAGTYKTRSATCGGAFVRLEFQDVAAGPYDSNDYWWSTGSNSLDLNAVNSGDLTFSLGNRSLWTNQAGRSAWDTETNWVDWTGETVAMSPYDGFSKAMKNVKEISLSFGNACSYASGVALDGGTGTFTVGSFTVQ